MNYFADLRRRRASSGGGVPVPTITAVSSNGWEATYDGTPSELILLEPFQASRSGYVGSTPTTITENLQVTQRVREPYPNEGTLTSDTVALSDYIYSTDTIADVTNNSTEASPKPIANWATIDHTVIGDTLTAEVVAFHRNARSREQVAGVRFYATDGTNNAEQLVTTSVVSGRAGDQNAVIVYRCNMDVSGLNDDAEITLNAEVFPHIGNAASVLDSADQTERREFSPRTYLRRTSGTVPIAYVSTTGNDGTGVVSTNAATAEASPFATISGAIGTTGGLRAFGDAEGAEIRLEAGTHVMTAAFGVDLVMSAADLKITPAPGEDDTTVTVTFGASGFRPRINAGGGWVTIEGCSVQRTGSSGLQGESDSQTEFRFVDCPFDNNSVAPSMPGGNGHALFLGQTFTNLGSSSLAPGPQDYRMFRGCTGVLASGVEGWLVIGCDWESGAESIASNANRTDGAISAFNKIEKAEARAFDYEGNGTSVSQIAVVQNVVEVVTSTSLAAIFFSADGAVTDVDHLVFHHNTVVGFDIYGRSNMLYDDGASVSTTRRVSVRGNLHCQINTKSDVFQMDGTRVGNWPYEYGVGCEGEYSLFRDASGGGIGSSFAQEYPGQNANIGTSNTTMNGGPANLIFTDFQATTSGPTVGAGGGDYSLVGGAAPKGNAQAVLRFDASGATRSATTSSGAYE